MSLGPIARAVTNARATFGTDATTFDCAYALARSYRWHHGPARQFALRARWAERFDAACSWAREWVIEEVGLL